MVLRKFLCVCATCRHELHLLDSIVRDAVSTVAYKYIEQHIENTCRGNYENRFLRSLEKWLSTTVMEWFRLLYKNQPSTETEAVLASLEVGPTSSCLSCMGHLSDRKEFNVKTNFLETIHWRQEP